MGHWSLQGWLLWCMPETTQDSHPHLYQQPHFELWLWLANLKFPTASWTRKSARRVVMEWVWGYNGERTRDGTWKSRMIETAREPLHSGCNCVLILKIFVCKLNSYSAIFSIITVIQFWLVTILLVPNNRNTQVNPSNKENKQNKAKQNRWFPRKGILGWECGGAQESAVV